MQEVPDFDEVKAWLVGFSDCVNQCDYGVAKTLFGDVVLYYGIHANLIHWGNDLADEEWSKEWPYIKDFKWIMEKRLVFASTVPAMHLACLGWTSNGYAADGKVFKRSGRATLLLSKRNTPLKCHHGHFTLNPGVPFHTYGPSTQTVTVTPEPI